MTSPIETVTSSGLTLYSVIHHPDGRVWRFDTQVWEAYNSGHWASYAVPMAEQAGSGYYSATYPSQIAGVLTTEVIYTQGGGTPALSDAPGDGLGQSQGSSVAAVNNDVTAALNLQANLDAMIQGAAASGILSRTQATTNLDDVTVGVYNGRLIMWTSGALIRQAAYIQSYAGSEAGGLLTFGVLTEAPAEGDTFIII